MNRSIFLLDAISQSLGLNLYSSELMRNYYRLLLQTCLLMFDLNQFKCYYVRNLELINL